MSTGYASKKRLAYRQIDDRRIGWGRRTAERRSVVEDALDDGGVLGRSGAEVPGRGVEGSVSEQGLDLGRVGSALAEARGEGVAAGVPVTMDP